MEEECDWAVHGGLMILHCFQTEGQCLTELVGLLQLLLRLILSGD